MNDIAILVGGYIIYWNGVVLFLAALACFALSFALFTTHGGRDIAMWLLLPLAVFFSVVLARAIHWYCHSEQYASFWTAVTDYSGGDFCLIGVLLGTVLAAAIVRLLGLTQNLRRLLDCLAPGAALGIALIRLSALFTSADRSKIVITDPRFQRLPFATAVGSEWRFATFFAQFLLMLLVFFLVLGFFRKRRRWPMKGGMPRDGHTALMFLTFYSAVELVTDSTRYDSSFLRLNGFVSLVQIVSAVTLLAILILYSYRSIRVNGRNTGHWVLWALFFVGVAVTGIMEYLVQRHGDWYLLCYSVMSGSCLLLAVVDYAMYRTVCGKKKKKKKT